MSYLPTEYLNLCSTLLSVSTLMLLVMITSHLDIPVY